MGLEASPPCTFKMPKPPSHFSISCLLFCYPQSFVTAVFNHEVFHSAATSLGHTLYAKDSSSPARDWRFRTTRNYHPNRNNPPLFLRDFPARLLPLFAYKDVAVYVPSIETRPSLMSFFSTVYREWYPTRDRTVFDEGMLKDGGGAFFSATTRVEFDEGPVLQPPALLSLLVHWHVALSRHLHSLIPQFEAFREGGARALVRPGLPQEKLQEIPRARIFLEYTPIMRPTFAECFIWIEREWEDNGVILVALGGGVLDRVSSGEWEGLTRDLDFEEQAKKVVNSKADREEEPREEGQDEQVSIDAEVSMGHVSIWRGNVQDVMRVVLAGDDTRQKGLREFNGVLGEWLGEGVNVGK